MKNKKLSKEGFKIILSILGICFIFALWWLLSFLINTTLFPTPLRTFEELFLLLSNSSTYLAIGGTLLRLLLAFIVSFLVAFVLGTISGLIKAFKIFLNPLIIVLRTIPTAALILVMVTLLIPEHALLIIVFLVMFPIIYESIVSGIENIDPYTIMALRIDANPYSLNSVFKVILPMSSPYILLGIIQSIGLGMKVSIMAEVLLGNPRIPGLGIIIQQAYIYAYMPEVFATAIIAIVLIGVVDIILHLAKKYINN
jgi:NitT/TauT family transport system permease protein